MSTYSYCNSSARIMQVYVVEKEKGKGHRILGLGIDEVGHDTIKKKYLDT